MCVKFLCKVQDLPGPSRPSAAEITLTPALELTTFEGLLMLFVCLLFFAFTC